MRVLWFGGPTKPIFGTYAANSKTNFLLFSPIFKKIVNFGILKDFERKYTEVSMGFCYSARQCKTQTYLKNDKIEFKHLKTNIEPMFGHMSVQ